MNKKLKLFIASSVESLDITRAVHANLDNELEVTSWNNGTFKLSSTTIDDLLTIASNVDFALFIFKPDDLLVIRENKKNTVRDNVVFELGLFIGAIGKKRSFILKPRSTEMHLPSDLLGVNFSDYEASRSDNNLFSATSKACTLILNEALKLGSINRASLSESKAIIANPANYELNNPDLKVLAVCFQTEFSTPTGLSFEFLKNSVRGLTDIEIQISLVKLARLGLINKTIETHLIDSYDYYAFSITTIGVDTLLKNEKLFFSNNKIIDNDEELPF